jgi:hypothetical protein
MPGTKKPAVKKAAAEKTEKVEKQSCESMIIALIDKVTATENDGISGLLHTLEKAHTDIVRLEI